MKIYIDKSCADVKKSKELLIKRHYPDKNYSIERLSNGKPIIISDGKEIGCVSISHTDGVLVMAFSDKPVGIDIERYDRKISFRICGSIEEWTKREAYGKYTGEGINKEILNMRLPNDIIKTFNWLDYIISVCCEEQIEGIETLIDNTPCKCYNK